MEVKTRGKDDPEFAVVGSVHGDEPCGKNAIKKILAENLDYKKPVKFIIANEEALKENKRFLDADLNRSFPGDIDSDKREEKLAAELLDEVKNTKVLDIHTTHSYRKPFATLSNLEDNILELAEATGVDKAVYFPEDSGNLTEFTEGVVVETGYQGSDQAVDNAVNVIKNFLSYFNIIDGQCHTESPKLYKYYETIEGNWQFLAENFEKVEKGRVYAENGGEQLKASEDFYPVLMSTNGYDGQLGFKAKKMDA